MCATCFWFFVVYFFCKDTELFDSCWILVHLNCVVMHINQLPWLIMVANHAYVQYMEWIQIWNCSNILRCPRSNIWQTTCTNTTCTFAHVGSSKDIFNKIQCAPMKWVFNSNMEALTYIHNSWASKSSKCCTTLLYHDLTHSTYIMQCCISMLELCTLA